MQKKKIIYVVSDERISPHSRFGPLDHILECQTLEFE